jgi:hypothetical protein
LHQSARYAHWFQLLGKALNAQLAERQRFRVTSDDYGLELDYCTDLVQPLDQALSQSISAPTQRAEMLQLFFECCRAVDYVRASNWGQTILVRAATVDAEFLLSHAFGLRTSIQGFDTLFGGGGLMLAEAPADDVEHRITGRTVLTTGRFGTGKSLLALQVALEVARKGGVAWFMPMEQTAEECLYALESVNLLPDDRTVQVAQTSSVAQRVLTAPKNDCGFGARQN